MLGQGHGSRRYNDVVTLTYATPVAGMMGHVKLGTPTAVATVYASIQRMSATKTMMTFQQADVVGLEVEFRNPGDAVVYNGLRWHGHDVFFSSPERLDNRGRFVRIQGWYQEDNPLIPPTPEPEPTPTPTPDPEPETPTEQTTETQTEP